VLEGVVGHRLVGHGGVGHGGVGHGGVGHGGVWHGGVWLLRRCGEVGSCAEEVWSSVGGLLCCGELLGLAEVWSAGLVGFRRGVASGGVASSRKAAERCEGVGERRGSSGGVGRGAEHVTDV